MGIMLGNWKDRSKENNEQNLVLPPILYPRYNSYYWQSTYTISYHTLKHDDIICLHWSCSFSVFFFLTFTVEKHRAFDRFFFFFFLSEEYTRKGFRNWKKIFYSFWSFEIKPLALYKEAIGDDKPDIFCLV